MGHFLILPKLFVRIKLLRIKKNIRFVVTGRISLLLFSPEAAGQLLPT